MAPNPKSKKVAEPDRVLYPGTPDLERCDNRVTTSRYTLLTFLPKAVAEQFRRFANLYFLMVGCVMAIGQYTELFESAISPWTTLGPLAVVISISLLVEGSSDYKRHKNDLETNNAPCVILRRCDDIASEEGAKRDANIIQGRDVIVNMNKAYLPTTENLPKDPVPTPVSANNVHVGFQVILRQDIRQGHIVLVKNREMVPADMLLLASSNDQGSAYIETSSIDGETNLKLRTTPQLPKEAKPALEGIEEETEEETKQPEAVFESIEAAAKRITRFSRLGRPDGRPAVEHPDYDRGTANAPEERATSTERPRSIMNMVGASSRLSKKEYSDKYVAVLTSEAPNASVDTFSGKLTLPPAGGDKDVCVDIPLGAENVLLRGAVLRNTEWVMGIAFFTGTDTKLVQNSFETPSKFSQLDQLMNSTVALILCLMFIIIVYLAAFAVSEHDEKFDELFYVGLNSNASEPWPYLREFGFDPPEWETEAPSFIQYFFLYITLLSNFVPLSLYVTIEFITVCSLWFIYADLDMYDDISNTRAVARSTIISDLGRIQYIFSDKTGTLTQNVMRFKRCSVDGMAFGAPIGKSRPGEEEQQQDENNEGSGFHPLRQLVVGRLPTPSQGAGLEGLGGVSSSPESARKLTFNAEMFLRVMSLCHTVVVEKDIDNLDEIGGTPSVASTSKGSRQGFFRRKKSDSSITGTGPGFSSPLASVQEDATEQGTPAQEVSSPQPAPMIGGILKKNKDGAPLGYAYQAESPDEGALVTAASALFGFQVVTRDSSGIRLRVAHPTHLDDERIVSGLRNKHLSPKRLSAETGQQLPTTNSLREDDEMDTPMSNAVREETWSILAVNKFDSDRKRMSILLRSPPELGSLPILFCKGADSSMLDPKVSDGVNPATDHEDGALGEFPNNIPKPASLHDRVRDVSNLSAVSELEDDTEGADDDVDEHGWEMAQMLGIQVHLGDFAKEGLRTLVLGMRVLSESDCERLLDQHKKAATSMKDRSKLLFEAAVAMETNLHIVGATAIEDKLQRGVPDTIATLEKAGIKLWVLTGDKRETAVEIGYSTHVLTPKMHLTEVADKGKEFVRTQMSMEFIRLVKMGLLQDYQKAALDDTAPITMEARIESLLFSFGKAWRSLLRSISGCKVALYNMLGMKEAAEAIEDRCSAEADSDKVLLEAIEQRRKVRKRADAIIQEWLASDEGKRQRATPKKPGSSLHDDDDVSLASEETPLVFTRAQSARSLLKDMRNSGQLSQNELRQMSLAHLTAQQVEEDEPVVDEDTLSLESFFVNSPDDLAGDFDKKRRTILERLFAIDREVRKGRLVKHVRKEKLEAMKNGTEQPAEKKDDKLARGPRALVIEGAALKHLLGDPELEDILFSVASKCEAVIACRVSPKQKAQLVNLVRQKVKPEPITLAIGDGANDVGMIQEAHVGVGISGREGTQAVNASDFAIAQFRFLEELVLIHGRWNFFRLSVVVLFSFYKNAILAGMLIVYTSNNVYSGTPLFDEWLIASFNFVAGMPIVVLGLFDRCLSKDYVRKNPEVYKATRENELITSRTLARWIFLVFIHIFTIYFFTVPQQAFGGGITSAFDGLMRNKDVPGDGEGGDLKSVGTVTYTCLIIMLAYKVLYESKSIVHGRWPAFTCRKDVTEGFFSRLAYSWVGVSWFSILFLFIGLFIYSAIGRLGPGGLAGYVHVAVHVLCSRLLSWMLILFVPIAAIAVDVVFKVFSNMFYPTQTQVHLEIEAFERIEQRKRRAHHPRVSRRAEEALDGNSRQENDE